MILLLALLAATSVAPLDEDPDFKAGRRLYEQLEFEKSIIRFQQALRVAGRSDDDAATLHMWVGVSYGQLGDFNAAGDSFREAVKKNPNVTFPVPVSPKLDTLLTNARAAQKGTLNDDAPDGSLADRKNAKESSSILEPALWGAAVATGAGAVLVAGGAIGLGGYAFATYAAASDLAVPQVEAQRLSDNANLAGGAAAVAGALSFGLLMTTMMVVGIALSGNADPSVD